jgi:hypothetical protein
VNPYFWPEPGGPPPDDIGDFEFDPLETPDEVADNLDPQPDEPCRPVDIERVSDTVAEAMDPTGQPVVRDRVLDTIEGIDTGEAPPEVCVGLDFPVWGLLRQYAAEWLLPGVGAMDNDAIVAMESNPAFVDAFLLGLNSQLMSELHWRNIPVDPRCTPLRMFWGPVDYGGGGARTPDIHGIDQWPADSDLGATSHQMLPPDDLAGKRDLVLVFHTELFRRYPQTLVYLVDNSQTVTAPPVFDGSELRLAPIFQGRIEEDIVFFTFDINPDDLDRYWVVLEEPPAELRFRSGVNSTAADGGQFAADTLDTQTRVAISGAHLEWMGTQL